MADANHGGGHFRKRKDKKRIIGGSVFRSEFHESAGNVEMFNKALRAWRQLPGLELSAHILLASDHALRSARRKRPHHRSGLLVGRGRLFGM
uniref:Uncharacterized protein n=1 Tax=Parascaris univalens TaxID=6257 RepID=A0A915A9H9_PARUN